MAQVKRFYATGRRKSSNARVYLYPLGDEAADMVVNGKALQEYFGETSFGMKAMRPLAVTEREDKYRVVVNVSGGGVSGQAQAIGHGVARALQTAEPELRPTLKKDGLLRRDPRIVERKKPGRHKARKRPQFSKR
jgi:small subunit ribosomal protein S9